MLWLRDKKFQGTFDNGGLSNGTNDTIVNRTMITVRKIQPKKI